MLRRLSIAALAILLVSCGGGQDAPDKPASSSATPAPANGQSADLIKLYVLDCGTIEISDIGVFSSAGDYDGQADTFVDTCFLVRHPKGDLLWDLGLPSALVGGPPQEDSVFTVYMDTTLSNQLIEIGMGPEEVDYLAISHHKFDHVGQIDQIQDAVWLVHEDEYGVMFPPAEEPLNEPNLAEGSNIDGTDVGLRNSFSGFEGLGRELFSGEYDVFDDGRVIIFPTPGPTPGHTSLQISLANTGTVLLTGDLYHRAESRELGRVPQFNASEPMTRQSMNSFEARAQRLNARVIIPHEPNDIDPLPKSPQYLD